MNYSSSNAFSASFSSAVYSCFLTSVLCLALVPSVYFIVFLLGESELHEDPDDEDDECFYFMIMAVRRAGL